MSLLFVCVLLSRRCCSWACSWTRSWTPGNFCGGPLTIDRHSSARSANGAPPRKAAHRGLGLTPLHAPIHSTLDSVIVAETLSLCDSPSFLPSTTTATKRHGTCDPLNNPRGSYPVGSYPVRRPAPAELLEPPTKPRSTVRTLQQYWRLSGDTFEPAATGPPRSSTAPWPRDRKSGRPSRC